MYMYMYMYIYIYIYICGVCVYVCVFHVFLVFLVCMHIYICCEVIIWSKFGVFLMLLSGPSWGFLKVIIWSKFVFLAYKNSGFKRFGLHTQLSFSVSFGAQLSGNSLKIAFFEKRVQKLGFSIFSVLSLSFGNSLF